MATTLQVLNCENAVRLLIHHCPSGLVVAVNCIKAESIMLLELLLGGVVVGISWWLLLAQINHDIAKFDNMYCSCCFCVLPALNAKISNDLPALPLQQMKTVVLISDVQCNTMGQVDPEDFRIAPIKKLPSKEWSHKTYKSFSRLQAWKTGDTSHC